MRERPLIDWLRRRIRLAANVHLGPGDDAAVLAAPAAGSRLVITTDVFLEGTHFAAATAPGPLGHKVMAASISDIAAMGCFPSASFVTLAINHSCGEAFVRELGEAIIATAEKYHAPLAGGDVASWPSPLAVSVTVTGETRGLEPVRRSGAQPGDKIFVTGLLGGSLLGRHLRAEPRLEEGVFLNRDVGVSAMIDISDGLSTDLGHLAEESGVGAVIRETAIPVSEDARKLEGQDGVPAVRHALDDGEDFELLFTVSPERAGRLKKSWKFDLAVTEIGEVGGSEVLLERADGARQRVEPGGYEHKWGE